MRKVVTVIAVVIVGVVGVALFFRYRGGNRGTSLSQTLLPQPSAEEAISSSPPANAPPGDKISIQGTQGVVTVNNFYRTARGSWPALGAVVIDKQDKYTLWYYKFNSDFEIALAAGASKTDEEKAEKALLASLGVSQSDLCHLSAYVTIVSDKIQGEREVAPLSFCPNALK